jgi:iron complex transport system ATP-binding protein
VSAVLRFDGVSFAYGPRTVLTEVSFTLAVNGLMALVGPNGAGKSTLLRLAAGLLPASKGRIEIEGRPVAAWPRRELARTVAFVPQHMDIPFPFTVEQIVAQGRTPYQGWLGGLSTLDREVVERAVQLTGIADVRARTLSEISGGERQRVKLAVALAQEPSLMLLDEPLQHLDIGRQSEFLDLLLSLHRGGLTIVAAMHDLAAVRSHFPVTLLLADTPEYVFGETQQVLTPERITSTFNLSPRHRGDADSYSHENVGNPRRTRPRHRKNAR